LCCMRVASTLAGARVPIMAFPRPASGGYNGKGPLAERFDQDGARPGSPTASKAAPGRGSPSRPFSQPTSSPTSSARGGRGVMGGSGRSPSPQGRMNINDLDQRRIVELSQSTTGDLDLKLREKTALTKLLADLKKKKLQFDTKISKKSREVDTTAVQTIEMNKKLEQMNASNKMMAAELNGLRSETERLEAEVEERRQQFQEASGNFSSMQQQVERDRRMINNYRKEIHTEAKQRDNIQSDLRASRTAQSLMINRLDEMEKRNKALKTCVADTFNSGGR